MGEGEGVRGRWGSLNGAGMDEWRGGEGLGERLPGSGGTQASSFCAKGHPTRIKIQKRPRDNTEHVEGKVKGTGRGGTKNATPPPGTGRGMGRRSRPAGGGERARE